VNTSAKEQFRADFWSTIKKEYEKARLSCIKGNQTSLFKNIAFKTLAPSIAYLFLMSDDVLFNKINECARHGFATKSELHELFDVKDFVFEKRIVISHDENLRIYYSQLIDDMAETYPLANPSFFNATKKTENGEIVDCGYISAIKKFASRGFSKQEICEMMMFNPASWYEYPVLEQSYSQGIVEFSSGKADYYLDAITQNFIRNNYFVEVAIPQVKIEAWEHKVWLIEKEYSVTIDEEGNEVKKLVREKHKEKSIPGNKEVRELALRFSVGKIIDKSILGEESNSKVKGIPMYQSKQITDRGTFDDKIEDAEYEPITD